MSEGHQRADTKLIFIAGTLLFVVSIMAFVQEARPEWAEAQDEVRRIVTERLGAERAAELPTGLQQIWVEETNRVDRCITCHTTIDWGPELADAPHPARSHPDIPWLGKHAIEKFGCTTCHGGQGSATTTKAAHGEVLHWEEPLLGETRARSYGLSGAELMEMRCNQCHLHEPKVEGMPLINAAKDFVVAKNCKRCHTIFGEGATRGPELTRIGEKHPTAYTFPKVWRHPRTALHWHIEHFKAPNDVVPNTMMPLYDLEGKMAEGLSLLVLSWRRVPATYIPRPRLAR